MESPKFGDEFIEEKYPDTKERTFSVTKILERMERMPKASKRFEEQLEDSFVLDIIDEATLTKLARSLYESEKRVSIERGHGGDIEKADLNDEQVLEKYKNAILEKEVLQRKSLESWFGYIKENDADYPMWFRYYVVRSLKSLGQFSREGKTYANRTDDTIAPFPEMNAEALAFVYKSLKHEFEKEEFVPIIGNVSLTPEEVSEVNDKVNDESKIDFALKGRLRNKKREIQKEVKETFVQKKDGEFASTLDLNEAKKKELTKELFERLKTKDFAKLYAFAQVECAGNLDRSSLEGEWVKYDKGSDYTQLENGLKGKGTGWCTAEGSAQGQIESGDFYVFYTKNKAGIPTEPRIAIRMSGDSIAEIRGIDPKQELEPDLVETAKEKYKDLPGSEKYEKASADMKKMTEIYRKCFSFNKDTKDKTYLNTELTKDELTFLYELHDSIQGFGYEKDPRIVEVRSQRNMGVDLSVIFECTPEQVAYKKEDITSETKAYIGEWNPEVLKLIPEGLTNIYEKFPDKKVFLRTIKTDPRIQSAEDAIKTLKSKNYGLTDEVKFMLDKVSFSKETVSYDLVSFSVEQLGFSEGANLKDIYAKAEELGLEKCPAEVGPLLRLQYNNQSNNEYFRIAMESIIVDSSGNPRLFGVSRDDSDLWLDGSYGPPDLVWSGLNRFVFLRRTKL